MKSLPRLLANVIGRDPIMAYYNTQIAIIATLSRIFATEYLLLTIYNILMSIRTLHQRDV